MKVILYNLKKRLTTSYNCIVDDKSVMNIPHNSVQHDRSNVSNWQAFNQR